MKNEKLEIKQQILKERLSKIFSKNPKKVAKVLSYLLKRHKNV